MEQYFLTDALSISKTDDINSDRSHCFFIGDRVFYGSGQMTLILSAIEQESELHKIAEKLNENNLGVTLSYEQVRALINEKLIPARIVSSTKNAPFQPSNRHSYLFFQRTLLNSETVARIGKSFSYLFAPKMAFPLLIVSFLLLLTWLFSLFGLDVSNIRPPIIFDETLSESLMFLVLLFISFMAHEFGHAASCLRYGVKPAEIGIALYLMFPVLYCNVTETWRLPRLARIVVNTGGVYFQLLFTSIIIFLQLLTHNEILTLVIFANLGSMLVTLNPFFRFDGYWIYSDFFRIPNLRERSRVATIDLLNNRMQGFLRVPQKSKIIISPALKYYAIGSFLFFAFFTITVAFGMYKFSMNLPHLYSSTIYIFHGTLDQNKLFKILSYVLITLIYLIGCGLSLRFLFGSLVRGGIMVQRSLSNHSPNTKTMNMEKL
ncbi:MAG TPA: hypothetical protein VNX68_16435 [Nitrosopumilaceae archaeon]|jgi:putative peptide zinc metalloprotease protein|nr:hypothetical protein [Nitrosopumilaceae archaeon]